MPRTAYMFQAEDNLPVRLQSERYVDGSERLDLHSRFDKPGIRYRFQLEQLAERQRRGTFPIARMPTQAATSRSCWEWTAELSKATGLHLKDAFRPARRRCAA